MKELVFKIILLILSTTTYCQTTVNSLGMTTYQNEEWLTNLKTVNKTIQLNIIKERFFKPHPTSIDNGKYDIPVLIIDGIPILVSDSINIKKRDFLLEELTADKIKKIQVIDEEPKGLYVNKRFTGIILITLSDKRTSEKLRKLN